MVEFVVALIAIMILLAGLVQIGTLTRAHADAQTAARQEAGQLALSDLYVGAADIQYIYDWAPGGDGRRYTRDDVADAFFMGSNIVASVATIVGYGEPEELEALRPGNPVSALATEPNSALLFDLVKGEESETVDTLPAIRSLVYDQPTVTVESEVWLTWAEGLY